MRSRLRSRLVSMAYLAQIIITSWRAELRAARRWAPRRNTRDPQAQRREKGHRGLAVFRPAIGGAKRPGTNRLSGGAARLQSGRLHLGPRRGALCEVGDLTWRGMWRPSGAEASTPSRARESARFRGRLTFRGRRRLGSTATGSPVGGTMRVPRSVINFLARIIKRRCSTAPYLSDKRREPLVASTERRRWKALPMASVI